MSGWRIGLIAGLLCWWFISNDAAATAPLSNPPVAPRHGEAARAAHSPPVAPRGKTPIDTSGRTETGRASYYARHFDYRRMADGRPFNPNANAVASKTLPLGTTAKVTNLRNGRAATVRVEDRGPFVDGRVVDLSPKVARDLNIVHQGVAPVEVKPITVPQPDGSVKLGTGAAHASPQEVQAATETTEALVDGKQTETASNR